MLKNNTLLPIRLKSNNLKVPKFMLISCPNCNSTFRVPDDAIGENGRIVRCSSCSNEWLVKPEAKSTDPILETNAVEAPSVASITASSEPDISAIISTQPALTENKPNISSNDMFGLDASAKYASSPLQEQSKTALLSPVKPTAMQTTSTETAIVKPSAKFVGNKLTAQELTLASPKAQTRFEVAKMPLYDSRSLRYFTYLIAILALTGLLTFYVIKSHNVITSTFPYLAPIYEKFGIFNNMNLKIELVEIKKQELKHSNDGLGLVKVAINVNIHNISKSSQTLSAVRFTVYNAQRNQIAQLIVDVNKTIGSEQHHIVSGMFTQLSADCTYVAIDLGNLSDFTIRNTEYININ